LRKIKPTDDTKSGLFLPAGFVQFNIMLCGVFSRRILSYTALPYTAWLTGIALWLSAIEHIISFCHFFPLATLSGKPIFANRCQQNCQQNIDFVDSK
jgi:hypothetical protein